MPEPGEGLPIANPSSKADQKAGPKALANPAGVNPAEHKTQPVLQKEEPDLSALKSAIPFEAKKEIATGEHLSDLSKAVFTESKQILENEQTNIWRLGEHRTVNRLKRLFAPLFGIFYGVKHPATIIPSVVVGPSISPVLVSAPLAEQALHFGTEAAGVGLAAGAIAAGGQMMMDGLYRVLVRKENHRHLLIRTLMRTSGGPEAWMMRKIALGNRRHIRQLHDWGEQIKSGRFTRQFVVDHRESIEKVLWSSYEAVAGRQTIEKCAPETVKKDLETKEGTYYTETIDKAYWAGQQILKDYFTDDERNEFFSRAKEIMKKKDARRTVGAVLARGGYQIARVGPWAFGASLATGIYHGLGIGSKVSGFLQEKLPGIFPLQAPAAPEIPAPVQPPIQKLLPDLKNV